MITIVIADDEKLIRAGLKKILQQELDIPLHIIEAKNGQEALRAIQEHGAELLITDIRMSVMDGIELMKRIQTLEHKPEMIVLSGYDDFSYARAAIQNKVSSYLLKPVDKKELITAVNSAIISSQKELKRRNEGILKNIIETGRVNDSDILSDFNLSQGLYYISIAGSGCIEMLEKRFAGMKYYVLEQKKDYICIAFICEGKNILDNIPSDPLTFGVSNSADNFSQMRIIKRQSFTALLQAFFNNDDGNPAPIKRSGIFYYKESGAEFDFSSIDKAYDKFINIVDIANTEEILEALANLLVFPEKTPVKNAEILYAVYTKITENLFNRFIRQNENDMYLHLKSIMIENIHDCANLSYWCSCVRDYAVYLAALLKQDTKEFPYISEAIEYIKTHYTKNINMAMVANQVSVNYTWFSEKFKQHTGVNFNEYLKRIRIEKAKQLLEKGCYKVYEVASRSGFGDVKYFMKIFREITGMSPTEWKSKHTR